MNGTICGLVSHKPALRGFALLIGAGRPAAPSRRCRAKVAAVDLPPSGNDAIPDLTDGAGLGPSGARLGARRS